MYRIPDDAFHGLRDLLFSSESGEKAKSRARNKSTDFVGETLKNLSARELTTSSEVGSVHASSLTDSINDYDRNQCESRTIYEGDYVAGKRQGKGKEYVMDGDQKVLVYHGRYNNDKRNDLYAWVRFPDGRTYVGEVVNDKLTGKGRMKYTEHHSYDGDFVDGQRHGHGKDSYIGKDDNISFIYEGEYVNDKRHGNGKIIDNKGKQHPCVYKNGKRVKVEGRPSFEKIKESPMESALKDFGNSLRGFLS